jgi:hypothetical protein
MVSAAFLAYIVSMRRTFQLYFHSSCFDGIVSSVMTADFLENRQGWTLNQLIPASYEDRGDWLSRELLTPCAVVDFHYHPQAVFWADHHGTTFLSYDAEKDFEKRRGAWMVFDPRSGSCAYLLRKYFAERLSFADPRYDEMVEWADKIDAARYASVEEAILGDTPALRIRASLAAGNGEELSKQLVNELRFSTLDEVAGLPLVRDRSEEVRSKIAAGLDRFAPAVRLDVGEIVVFNVTSQKGVVLSRYAPYHFFPEARYSVGVVRSTNGAKITAMRNPWRDFPSVNLGEIFKDLEKTFDGVGGGGHQRVASVILSGKQSRRAADILAHIVRQIREQDELAEVVA